MGVTPPLASLPHAFATPTPSRVRDAPRGQAYSRTAACTSGPTLPGTPAAGWALRIRGKLVSLSLWPSRFSV
jgi:hypothetical protein